MSNQSTVVTIPNITLSLDQLLAAVRQLDEPARRQVARTLLESQMDAELAALIEQLAQRPPADDLSEADIAAEVRAVRQPAP